MDATALLQQLNQQVVAGVAAPGNMHRVSLVRLRCEVSVDDDEESDEKTTIQILPTREEIHHVFVSEQIMGLIRPGVPVRFDATLGLQTCGNNDIHFAPVVTVNATRVIAPEYIFIGFRN